MSSLGPSYLSFSPSTSHAIAFLLGSLFALASLTLGRSLLAALREILRIYNLGVERDSIERIWAQRPTPEEPIRHTRRRRHQRRRNPHPIPPPVPFVEEDVPAPPYDQEAVEQFIDVLVDNHLQQFVNDFDADYNILN